MCWMLVDRIDGTGRRVLVWLNCLPKQQHNIQGEWMSCVFSFWWRRERWWKGNEIHLRLFGAMLSGFLVLFKNFVFCCFIFWIHFTIIMMESFWIFSMFLQRFFCVYLFWPTSPTCLSGVSQFFFRCSMMMSNFSFLFSNSIQLIETWITSRIHLRISLSIQNQSNELSLSFLALVFGFCLFFSN